MGYVHDTHMSKQIPLQAITTTVGTWAMAVASNIWSLDKSAADNTSVLNFPVSGVIEQNSSAAKGVKVTSVDIWYTIGTAAADDVEFVLYKATLPANGGSAPSASTVTTSYDAGHDTDAERYAVTVIHKMTVTITTPEWIDDDTVLYGEMTINAAATSVPKILAARVNYTLRV